MTNISNYRADRLKRKAHANLWPDQIQTWIRIGLPAVREVLVKYADVDLPMVVEFVSHPCTRQNVECKILALRSAQVRVAVDPTETEPAGKIRNEPPVRPDK